MAITYLKKAEKTLPPARRMFEPQYNQFWTKSNRAEMTQPAILYSLGLCGADRVLSLGGVQSVAAMAFGLFGCPKSNALVGPGNQFVTWDLVGQAEHGYNSPVWLISFDQTLAEKVAELVPGIIETLPEPNQSSAREAWTAYGEIIVTDTRDEAVTVSEEYASEHLQIQAADLDWWLENLTNYGLLFLGEETTVAFGDKCSGPNHVLPTKGTANYTGDLSVAKYMKTVTWQRMTRDANRQIALATARISRLEGMERHARTADVRLENTLPRRELLPHWPRIDGATRLK